MKDVNREASRIVVGLDIGTTKITTVIGETGPDGVIDIIGEGTVPSEGLKRGVVVNLERTINSIRNSIATAERVSGVRVLDAYVGVAGGHIKALSSHGLAAIRRGQEIARSDVERAIENAKAVPLDPNLEVIHALPGEYVVDGQGEIKNPIGMHGVRLEVDVHIVTGAQGPMANLRRCASEAGLTVNSLALQGFASGLAVLEPAEEDSTTILIDMGGGTTDVAVFKKGNLVFSAVIPLGGDHVTADIAQILKIPTDEAERVKKKYGSAVPELADQDLTLELTKSGMVTSVSPFDLSRIIKPRVAEIFNFVRNEIDASLGPVEMISQNVVLTGGSSLMRGIVELAEGAAGHQQDGERPGAVPVPHAGAGRQRRVPLLPRQQPGAGGVAPHPLAGVLVPAGSPVPRPPDRRAAGRIPDHLREPPARQIEGEHEGGGALDPDERRRFEGLANRSTSKHLN